MSNQPAESTLSWRERSSLYQLTAARFRLFFREPEAVF